ncbi:MAG: sulfurtransferase TusA family protein [Immundisolibacter sp.]|uniref:sulfurtransferase TusA family protein n=1 Tax=Immundisolibacter sp. TaxID=1934948 RepID=UPI003EE275E2
MSVDSLITLPQVDLSSYGCPLHYVKARQTLSRMAPGERVAFLFSAGELAEQVRDSLAQDGHRVLTVRTQGDTLRVEVAKAG